MHNSEYPYYHPYYSPPPPIPNYFSVGSNSTPSSTATGSVVGLGNLGADIDASTERDMEEEVGEQVSVQGSEQSKIIND